MLGKTNIIYVTKDQGSEMQFVAEPIVTRSSSDIKKIKYLNGLFFAFTNDNSVLYGKDIANLNFLKNGEELVIASDAEFLDGKYIFINDNIEYSNRKNIQLEFMSSIDLLVFEENNIPWPEDGVEYVRWVGVVINSYDQLTILAVATNTSWGSESISFLIYIYGDVADTGNFGLQKSDSSYTVGQLGENFEKKYVFMRDKFLFYTKNTDRNLNDIEYCHCITLDAMVNENQEGNFPVGVIDNVAYYDIEGNTYYSLNFINHIKIRSRPITSIFPIGGRIGLYDEGTLELASKVTDFTLGKSKELQILGIDYDVLCFVATDEYTFLGCTGGIIIQCFLDVEGTYHTPEITLVRTLSAKQALSQSKEYTDKKIAELRDYIDSNSV